VISPQNEPSRLYKLYRLLVAPAILWYVWVAHYAVTASMGETIEHARWAIIVNVFVATPIAVIIGLLIMRRLPGNVIGPALFVYSATLPSQAIHALVIPPAQESLNEFILWMGMFPAQLVLLSHFPTGTLHPRRLLPVIYLMWILMLIAGFGSFLAGPTSYGSDLAYGELRANPFLIDALEPIGRVIQQDLNYPIVFICGFGPIFVAIYRYSRTSTIERKQIRWLLLGYVITSIGYVTPVLFSTSNQVVMAVSAALALDSFIFPTTIGIGILLYRLWDVDVIIRRTVTYAILSALLVGTYLLIVLIFQSLLSGVIASDSSALIVISTLTVAILFNPLRQRVQQIIDRVFYRKRYDAEATLESFSEQIRHATEADVIQKQLIQSISGTIQPKTIAYLKIERKP